MRITRRQLRQIIKEELDTLSEQDSPVDPIDRLEFLRNEHQGEFALLDRLGEEGFKEVIKVRDEILANPSLEGYGGYQEFFNRVKEKYSLFPKTVRELYDERYGKVDLEDLKSLKSEYEGLSSQFEDVDDTGTVDSMYGRRRTQTVRKDTGDVVRTRVDATVPGLGS